MEGGSSFGGCHDMLSLLENPNNIWLPSSSPFNETMMNFDQEPQQAMRATLKRNRNDGPFARASDGEDTGEEDSELNLHSEKKRRLTSEQVKFLEKSFGEENKLEPERKLELAKQLGLQPRQVAIWFQNRRARYKTKQIEKEYDTLKASFDRLKEDYDSLYEEKESLRNEVQVLKKVLGEKEKDKANSNVETNLQFDELDSSVMGLHGVANETNSEAILIPCTKQVEDASSAKSDIFDSESPPCTDNANQSSSALVVEASSTLMRELDQQSDFSQEDEENLLITNSLLLPQTPPTFNNFLNVTEDGNFSLVDGDQSSFWSWLY